MRAAIDDWKVKESDHSSTSNQKKSTHSVRSVPESLSVYCSPRSHLLHTFLTSERVRENPGNGEARRLEAQQ